MKKTTLRDSWNELGVASATKFDFKLTPPHEACFYAGAAAAIDLIFNSPESLESIVVEIRDHSRSEIEKLTTAFDLINSDAVYN